MATVVNQLFEQTDADKAVFGEKDFQQLRVIQQMVLDRHLQIEVIAAPTLREADGLAMSSRNGHCVRTLPVHLPHAGSGQRLPLFVNVGRAPSAE